MNHVDRLEQKVKDGALNYGINDLDVLGVGGTGFMDEELSLFGVGIQAAEPDGVYELGLAEFDCSIQILTYQ